VESETKKERIVNPPATGKNMLTESMDDYCLSWLRRHMGPIGIEWETRCHSTDFRFKDPDHPREIWSKGTPDRVICCQIVCADGNVVNTLKATWSKLCWGASGVYHRTGSKESKLICTVQLVFLAHSICEPAHDIIARQSEETVGAPHDSACPVRKMVDESGG